MLGPTMPKHTGTISNKPVLRRSRGMIKRGAPKGIRRRISFARRSLRSIRKPRLRISYQGYLREKQVSQRKKLVDYVTKEYSIPVHLKPMMKNGLTGELLDQVTLPGNIAKNAVAMAIQKNGGSSELKAGNSTWFIN